MNEVSALDYIKDMTAPDVEKRIPQLVDVREYIIRTFCIKSKGFAITNLDPISYIALANIIVELDMHLNIDNTRIISSENCEGFDLYPYIYMDAAWQLTRDLLYNLNKNYNDNDIIFFINTERADTDLDYYIKISQLEMSIENPYKPNVFFAKMGNCRYVTPRDDSYYAFLIDKYSLPETGYISSKLSVIDNIISAKDFLLNLYKFVNKYNIKGQISDILESYYGYIKVEEYGYKKYYVLDYPGKLNESPYYTFLGAKGNHKFYLFELPKFIGDLYKDIFLPENEALAIINSTIAKVTNRIDNIISRLTRLHNSFKKIVEYLGPTN